MDLTTTAYETWDDLCGYMEGSAAVIGEMMLPVLEPTSPMAKEPARALGLAFQLTNFLRDVDEDLDRGRVYVPQEDLRRFGVDLARAGRRPATPEWRAFLAFEIARNRELYALADTGIALLPAALGPLRRGGPGALQPDPRADRGRRLRRLHHPGPGAHLAQGADRRAHHGGRARPRRDRRTRRTADQSRRHPRRRRPAHRPQAAEPAAARSPMPERPRIPLEPGAAAARGPDDLDLAAGQAARGSPPRSRRPRRRTRAAGSSPGPAPTSAAPSRSPAPSPAARSCCGATATATLVAGPGACPHLGALMDRCPVLDGTMYCRWHGLAFDPRGRPRPGAPTAPSTTACWSGSACRRRARSRPSGRRCPPRPPLGGSVAAVIAEPGVCEPQDVIANRLDPWHGSWFHPYAFSHLVVDDDGQRRAHAGRRRDLPAEPDLGRARPGRVHLPRRPHHRHADHRGRGRRQRRGDPRHPARRWTARAGR